MQSCERPIERTIGRSVTYQLPRTGHVMALRVSAVLFLKSLHRADAVHEVEGDVATTRCTVEDCGLQHVGENRFGAKRDSRRMLTGAECRDEVKLALAHSLCLPP